MRGTDGREILDDSANRVGTIYGTLLTAQHSMREPRPRAESQDRITEIWIGGLDAVDQHKRVIALAPAKANLRQARSSIDGDARNVAQCIRDLANLPPCDHLGVEHCNGNADKVGINASFEGCR